MAKPNKMGMSASQLRASRAARFSSAAAARSERVAKEMDADGSAEVIRKMQEGKITKEEAAEWFRKHR